MNIIREYTTNYVKSNRKNGIALFLSIMAATLLVNAYVFFIYSIIWDKFEYVKKLSSYDGQTYSIPISKVPIVEQNQFVKSISLNQSFAGKIKGLKAFFMAEAGDKRFWNDYQESIKIEKGRIPENYNEVMLNDSFFLKYPQYKIGDKIEMDLGYRFLKEEQLQINDNFVKGEKFKTKKNVSLKIVGSFTKFGAYTDVYESAWVQNTGGVVVAYYLCDFNKFAKDENISVNIKLASKRNAYNKLNIISKNLGFKKEKDGNYPILINKSLLEFYGVRDPSKTRLNTFEKFMFYSILGLVLIMSFFIFLIYNVFEVWANNKVKQIAMIKSIGASSKQIFHSFALEGIYIGILPIISGVILGLGFNSFLFNAINKISNSEEAQNASMFGFPEFHFSFIAMIGVILFSFLTVLISSFIPARRLAKLNIIDALKGNVEKKKNIKMKIAGNNNWTLEIRKNNFRSFKGTANAIFASFILLFGLLSLIVTVYIYDSHKHYKYKNEMHVSYSILDSDEKSTAEKVFKDLSELDTVSNAYYTVKAMTYFVVTDDMLSNEFKFGQNFDPVHLGRYYWNGKEKNTKVLRSKLLGLDDNAFKKLLKEAGENPESYYDDNSYKAVLLNSVQKDWRHPYSKSEFIPFLKPNIKKINFVITNNAKGENKHEKNNTKEISIPVTIGKTIMDSEFLETKMSLYHVTALMPLSKVEKLRDLQIQHEKKFKKQFLNGKMYSFIINCDEKALPSLRKEVRKIMGSKIIGRNSYFYSDVILNKLAIQANINFFRIVSFSFLSLVLFASCINAYSAIKLNLNNRKNEFALLRSIGADENTIKEIFKKEAFYFIINPLLKALPLGVLIMAFPILKFDIVFASDFLKTFDWLFFILFITCIAVTISLLYKNGVKKMLNVKVKEIE